MKLSRIRFAFPWRIAAILALVPCLPILAFWAWFRWEVPPLQRYYFTAYWDSSEGAKQPGAQTQIQWLMTTAHGRKRQWCIGSDVTDGSQNGLSLQLSPTALKQGWVGIERASVESMGSGELEGVLREYFYNGVRFRQLVNEPLLDGVAAWVIVAYLAFMMREDIGDEWRHLRRAVEEPKWSSNYGGDWPENREGIVARIRSRMAHWISAKNVQLQWANFRTAINRRSSFKKFPNPESLHGSNRPASTEVQGEVSTAPQLPNPLPAHSPQLPPPRRTIFPGSSPSDAGHSQSEPWNESEWID
jgi:hypothetical protein